MVKIKSKGLLCSKNLFFKLIVKHENSFKTVHAFYDESCSRIANEQPLLLGSTRNDVLKAEKLSIDEWFGGYLRADTGREMCRLGVGPLIKEFVGQLDNGKAKAYFYRFVVARVL
jgi:hypothetical protein